MLTREESDWWPALRTSDAEVQDLLSQYPATIAELPPLATSVDERGKVLAAAAVAYAEALDVPEPDVSGVDIRADHFGEALFLHIAALAAIEGEFPHSEDDLLGWLVDREERHWRKGLVQFEITMRSILTQSGRHWHWWFSRTVLMMITRQNNCYHTLIYSRTLV